MPKPDDASPPRPSRPEDPYDARLSRLRQWRNRPEPDLSLRFIKTYFKHEVERPHKQLGALGEIWGRLIPPALLEHTRLEALTRGVLRVTVDSSAHLYQLDRLLRAGLEHQIIKAHKGPAFTRIQLRVAASDFAQPGQPAPPTPDVNDE